MSYESLVTVIIPFQEGEDEGLLQEAVRSVPDGVRVLVERNDGDLAGALNRMLAQVDTEFVFYLSADDVVDHKCLYFLVEMAEDADVTYPTLVLTTPDLAPFESKKAVAFSGPRLLRWNFVPGCSVARTAKVREAGGWNPDLERLEDWDLWVRMYRNGCRFKAVPEAIVCYRQRETSRNKTTIVKTEADVDRIRADYRARIVGTLPEAAATWNFQAAYATTYWRCLVPANRLGAPCVEFLQQRKYTTENPDGTMNWHLPDQEGPVSVWQFPGDVARALAIGELQQQGKRVLVEVDDNYTVESPYAPWWSKKASKENPHSLEGHVRIVKEADGVIVSTPRLQSIYRKLNPNVYVCRNSVEPMDFPPLVKPDDGVIRVGFFGSASHREDMPIVWRAMEWASRQPNVEVWAMGLKPGVYDFPHRYVPWTNDIGAYWRVLQYLDIGLAPLKETVWATCRSDLKVLEYAMNGVLPVVQDSSVFAGWDDDAGVWRCRNAEAFVRALKYLVTRPDQVKERAARVRDRVLAERTIEKSIWQWEEAFEQQLATV